MEKVGVTSPIPTPEIARKLLGLEFGRKRGKSSEGILNASSIPTPSLHGLCGVTCVESNRNSAYPGSALCAGLGL